MSKTIFEIIFFSMYGFVVLPILWILVSDVEESKSKTIKTTKDMRGYRLPKRKR